MAAKTDFTPNDLRGILADYDLGEFVSFKAFDTGADQTNLRVTTSIRDVVLRYYEKRTHDYAFFEIDLLHYLAEHDYPTAAPIINKQGGYIGEYASKPFALFEFMPGEHSDKPSKYLQIAPAIAKLNRITQDYQSKTTPDRPPYTIEYCERQAVISAARIEDHGLSDQRLSWLRNELHGIDLPDSLPKGICHGDANPGNFLYTDGQLSAVLDFDQANYTWLVYDLANLIYWWTWPDKGELDVEATKQLVQAYEQERKLENLELAHIMDALKLVIANGMAWFLDQGDDYENGKRKIELINTRYKGLML